MRLCKMTIWSRSHDENGCHLREFAYLTMDIDFVCIPALLNHICSDSVNIYEYATNR